MKKAVLAFFSLFISSYANAQVIEIREKMFIAQTNDIYLNSKDYLGKTIKLEGVFAIEDFPWQERPFYFVLRFGPGCCAYDGSSGFEVMWDKNSKPGATYPRDNDWVEAVGILNTFDDEGIYIALTALTVLEKRGSEFVKQ
jgi:uncharacterized membrane protein YcgQ (UPF0703/DUF1980 family)